MKFLIALSCLWACTNACAQGDGCHFAIRGIVQDDSQRRPVGEVTIAVEQTQTSSLTDSAGAFELTGMCAGTYTLSVIRLGSKASEQTLFLSTDTSIVIHVHQEGLLLKEVEIVSGKANKVIPMESMTTSEISGIGLLQTRGQSLGESLKEIVGVNSMQTGPTISKPVIHGLYSNRVLMLNNGVRQEGQQWGSEHAPEIDPFIASKISVIKGAASIRYGSDAIGGVILLEPEELPGKPGIGASFTAVAGSNGLLGGTSAMVEGALGKKLKGLSWRVQGTVKRAGNFRTANYYMKNTSFSEGDFSGALQYHRNSFGINAFYSEYNSKLGIFEGSHVGNIADLYASFSRSRPITPLLFQLRY